MAINFKDIKKNFFIDYLKYWVVFFVILLIYFLNLAFKHFMRTDKITMGIENAIYITSGVAVNGKYVIADKHLLEASCIGKISGLRGHFYIVNQTTLYPAVIERGDAISNMVLLRLTQYRDNLDYYAFLPEITPEYIINQRVFIPFTINKPGFFNFKKSRIVGKNDTNFFIGIKNIGKKEKIIGFPVFDKNYVLQGIIRSTNSNYSNKTSRDNVLEKANVQKIFLVNSAETIRIFLNRFNIEYSIINTKDSLEKTAYNPKGSVVNIICIKVY